MFFLSAKIDTKWRNCINSLLIEAFQVLKFYLMREHLNFTNGWIIVEKKMLKDEPNEDLL